MAMKRPGAYVALATNYADDEAVMEVGEHAELMYIRILAFCGRTPKTEGWISDKQIRTRLGLEVIPEIGPETAPEARARRLAEVGLLTREGDGYRVTSWLKWNRSAEEIERARTQDRGRKAAPTSTKTGRRTGTDTGNATGAGTGIQDPETETETETEVTTCAPASAEREAIERDFAEWYALYPRKKGKGAAIKAYRGARKKADAATLLDGLRAALPELRSRSTDKVPYPGSWLNGEFWLDEDDAPDNVHHLPTSKDDPTIPEGAFLLPPLPPRSPFGPTP